MNTRIIKRPSQGAMDILIRRISDQSVKSKINEMNVNAVGLIQGQLADIITASDITEKASNVIVCEITGVCPQHVAMIAVFGDTSSVDTAVKAVDNELKKEVLD